MKYTHTPHPTRAVCRCSLWFTFFMDFPWGQKAESRRVVAVLLGLGLLHTVLLVEATFGVDFNYPGARSIETGLHINGVLSLPPGQFELTFDAWVRFDEVPEDGAVLFAFLDESGSGVIAEWLVRSSHVRLRCSATPIPAGETWSLTTPELDILHLQLYIACSVGERGIRIILRDETHYRLFEMDRIVNLKRMTDLPTSLTQLNVANAESRTHPFRGVLDEIRVFRKALSPLTLDTLWNQVPSSSWTESSRHRLVVYFSLDTVPFASSLCVSPEKCTTEIANEISGEIGNGVLLGWQAPAWELTAVPYRVGRQCAGNWNAMSDDSCALCIADVVTCRLYGCQDFNKPTHSPVSFWDFCRHPLYPTLVKGQDADTLGWSGVDLQLFSDEQPTGSPIPFHESGTGVILASNPQFSLLQARDDHWFKQLYERRSFSIDLWIQPREAYVSRPLTILEYGSRYANHQKCRDLLFRLKQIESDIVVQLGRSDSDECIEIPSRIVMRVDVPTKISVWYNGRESLYASLQIAIGGELVSQAFIPRNTLNWQILGDSSPDDAADELWITVGSCYDGFEYWEGTISYLALSQFPYAVVNRCGFCGNLSRNAETETIFSHTDPGMEEERFSSIFIGAPTAALITTRTNDPLFHEDTIVRPQGSVRWRGELMSPVPTHRETFTITTNDGHRMWMNGRLLGDAWFDAGSGTLRSEMTIMLEQCQGYLTELRYFQRVPEKRSVVQVDARPSLGSLPGPVFGPMKSAFMRKDVPSFYLDWNMGQSTREIFPLILPLGLPALFEGEYSTLPYREKGRVAIYMATAQLDPSSSTDFNHYLIVTANRDGSGSSWGQFTMRIFLDGEAISTTDLLFPVEQRLGVPSRYTSEQFYGGNTWTSDLGVGVLDWSWADDSPIGEEKTFVLGPLPSSLFHLRLDVLSLNNVEEVVVPSRTVRTSSATTLYTIFSQSEEVDELKGLELSYRFACENHCHGFIEEDSGLTGRGQCTKHGKCICDYGYEGRDCHASCVHIGNCLGRGKCVAPNVCTCDPGFSGVGCACSHTQTTIEDIMDQKFVGWKEIVGSYTITSQGIVFRPGETTSWAIEMEQPGTVVTAEICCDPSIDATFLASTWVKLFPEAHSSYSTAGIAMGLTLYFVSDEFEPDNTPVLIYSIPVGPLRHCEWHYFEFIHTVNPGQEVDRVVARLEFVQGTEFPTKVLWDEFSFAVLSQEAVDLTLVNPQDTQTVEPDTCKWYYVATSHPRHRVVVEVDTRDNIRLLMSPSRPSQTDVPIKTGEGRPLRILLNESDLMKDRVWTVAVCGDENVEELSTPFLYHVALCLDFWFSRFDEIRGVFDIRTSGEAELVDEDTGVFHYRLTSDAPLQKGAMWYCHGVALRLGFETHFTFSILPPDGEEIEGCDDPPFCTRGEGFAFVIQQSIASDMETLGEGGPSLGFGGLTHNFAVEFDSKWSASQNDPQQGVNQVWMDGHYHTRMNTSHLAAFSSEGGTNSNIHPRELSSGLLTTNIADGREHTVRITYFLGRLEIFLDELEQNPVLDFEYDLTTHILDMNGRAFIGFTASTGTTAQKHRIHGWTFCGCGGCRH